MWLLMFLPVFFLPLAAPRYLVGLLLPISTLMLTQRGASVLIPFLHYGAWLLPALFISTIYGIKHLVNGKFIIKYKNLIVLTILTEMLYIFIAISPLSNFTITLLTKKGDLEKERVEKGELLNSIEEGGGVIASRLLLTDLSKRKNLYYLGYLFNNQHQFSKGYYNAPQGADYILFEPIDLLIYNERSFVSPNFFPDVSQLLFQFVNEQFGLEKLSRNYILLSSVSNNKITYYEELYTLPPDATPLVKEKNVVDVLGWSLEKRFKEKFPLHLLLNLFIELRGELKRPLYWKITVRENGFIHYSSVVPASLGILTSSWWPQEKLLKMLFILPLQKLPKEQITIEIAPVIISGDVILSGFSSSEFVSSDVIPIGKKSTILLGIP